MGFSDLLFGSRTTHVEQLPDRIWLKPQAKFTGLAEDLAQRVRSGASDVLLAAHFPDALSPLVWSDSRLRRVALTRRIAFHLEPHVHLVSS